MDESGVLTLLAVITAVNSVVLLVLAIATFRPRPVLDRRGPGEHPIGLVATDGSDPLAGAISAFLTRPDGLFRTGGGPIEPVRPGPRPTPSDLTQHPQVGSPTPSISTPSWVPSSPTRYVASAPRPAAGRPVDESLVVGGPVVPVPSRPIEAQPQAPAAAHPASQVSIWFVGRDASRSTVGAGPVARLGPVIAGLLRERTRAEDRVAVEGGRRFVVTLPDTPIDGAAALTRRLANSCDAWLAAEEPPLRLEFGMSEVPGAPGIPAGPADRAVGADRRRPVPLDA